MTDFTFTVKADGTVTLGAIAQGETVVAENGKVTVTDNAKPDPQPGPQPGPKPEPNKPNVEKNSKLPKTGITQVSSIVVAIISGISIITVKRRNK
ncbi:LPXTG cell wall anchor domain-containing protein [Parvimonas sp. G1641]|uniref:LPXTG cell wall anchor domain-containing protein n=1 Tax=Parvimonas sp. G1641 TaxID=3388846 RepID=UPI00397F9AF0